MEDSEWRSSNFRQKLVSQIEEVMRKAGVVHNETNKDMENYAYMKARSRDDIFPLWQELLSIFGIFETRSPKSLEHKFLKMLKEAGLPELEQQLVKSESLRHLQQYEEALGELQNVIKKEQIMKRS